MTDEEKKNNKEIENQKKEESVEEKKLENPKEVPKKSEGLVYLAVVIAAMIIVSGALVYWAFTHHKVITINNTVKKKIVKNNTTTPVHKKSIANQTNSSNKTNEIKIVTPMIIYYTNGYNISKSQLNSILNTLNGKIKQVLTRAGIGFSFNVSSVRYVKANNSNVPIVPFILFKVNPIDARILEELKMITPYNSSYYMFTGFFEKYLFGASSINYKPLLNAKLVIISGEIVKPNKEIISELSSIISKESYINVSGVEVYGLDNYSKYINKSFTKYPVILLESNQNLSKYYIFLGEMGTFAPKKVYENYYSLPSMIIQAIFKAMEITQEPNITGLPVLGSNNAKVTIIEFADLHCPYCAMFAKDIENITSTYIKNGTVNYVFIIFPIHPSAMPLHKMLMCYWRLSHNATDYYKIIQWNYNTFLKNQEPVSSEEFENEVKNYYNIMSVENCVSENNTTLMEKLRSNLNEGMSFGIFGTPGIVIWNNEAHRGIVIVGYIDNQTLRTYIQKVLSME